MREPYNGYTNYPTWNAALWMHNDSPEKQRFYEKRVERLIEEYGKLEAKYLLADEIKEEIELGKPEIEASTYSDLLNYAISEINFIEVAETFIEE